LPPVEETPEYSKDDQSFPPAGVSQASWNAPDGPTPKPRSDRFNKFLSRQVNATLETRLELALFQRDQLEKLRQTSASAKQQGVDAFRKLLVGRFGTITAAWRQCLDPASTGKLSFSDFCQCCRDLGFQRKMKGLWTELDTDRRGWITLDHLDPVAAQLLRDFRQTAQDVFGSLLKCWHEFDMNKNNRLDLDEFIEACEMIKFKGNLRHLFQCMKKDVSKSYLTIQDFDEKSMQCLHRGDTSGTLTLKKRQSATFPGSMTFGGTMPQIRSGQSTMQRSASDFYETATSSVSSMQRSQSDSKMHNKMAKTTGGFRPRLEHSRTSDNMNSRWLSELSKEQIRHREQKKKERDDADVGSKTQSAFLLSP
jgi:hypothetical protein